MISKNRYNAIILAPEITKGMKSIGSKALLPVSKNMSIIEYQINCLKKYYNPIDIFVCTGFDHEKIRKKTSKYKNIHYIYNSNYATDNHGASISLCLQQHKLDSAIILNNGVLMFNKLPSLTTSSIFTMNECRNNEFEIGCSSGTKIDYLFYGLPTKWAECMYLDHNGMQIIKDIIKTKNIDKLFLFEIINLILIKMHGINTLPVKKNTFIKINSLKDVTIAKKHYEKSIRTQIQ